MSTIFILAGTQSSLIHPTKIINEYSSTLIIINIFYCSFILHTVIISFCCMTAQIIIKNYEINSLSLKCDNDGLGVWRHHSSFIHHWWFDSFIIHSSLMVWFIHHWWFDSFIIHSSSFQPKSSMNFWRKPYFHW